MTNQTQDNLKKNKPSIVLPIINSCLSVIFFVGAILCKIYFPDQFSDLYFTLFMIIVILFPFASWYNSYFSKKKNIKKINNYEHESKEIVAYINRLKTYSGVELNKKYTIKATYIKSDEIINKTPSYDTNHCSLGLPLDDSIILTFGIGFGGINIKPHSKEIAGICGVLPRSIWYKRHLNPPTPKKGKVMLEAVGFEFVPRLVIQALKNQDTYYDNKTGWLLIGEKKPTILDEVVEFMNDTYLVIRNEEIVSLWIKLQPNLAI